MQSSIFTLIVIMYVCIWGVIYVWDGRLGPISIRWSVIHLEDGRQGPISIGWGVIHV